MQSFSKSNKQKMFVIHSKSWKFTKLNLFTLVSFIEDFFFFFFFFLLDNDKACYLYVDEP